MSRTVALDLDSECSRPVVTSLASGAYDKRCPQSGELDPVRLAIPSDASKEAGRDDATDLDHRCHLPSRLLGSGCQFAT